MSVTIEKSKEIIAASIKQYDPAHIRNLMCAVLLAAAEDYCEETSSTTRRVLPNYFFNKSTIQKDLHNPRLVALTEGMSVTVADALKTNANKIKQNLKDILYNADNEE